MKHHIGNQHRWSQRLSGYKASQITLIPPLKNDIVFKVLAVLQKQGIGHHFNYQELCCLLLEFVWLGSSLQFWLILNVLIDKFMSLIQIDLGCKI
jgi:hypothetical protein